MAFGIFATVTDSVLGLRTEHPCHLQTAMTDSGATSIGDGGAATNSMSPSRHFLTRCLAALLRPPIEEDLIGRRWLLRSIHPVRTDEYRLSEPRIKWLIRV